MHNFELGSTIRMDRGSVSFIDWRRLSREVRSRSNGRRLTNCLATRTNVRPKVRVLVLVSGMLSHGGIQRFNRSFCNALAHACVQRGYVLEVISFQDPDGCTES